jgi:hypothetical protein
MKSAIRLVACVIQVGAFAPAFAGTGEKAEMDASGEYSTSSETREEMSTSRSETASGPESGIGTESFEESEFRRTASEEITTTTRSDAMELDEEESARRQAEVEEIWTRH